MLCLSMQKTIWKIENPTNWRNWFLYIMSYKYLRTVTYCIRYDQSIVKLKDSNKQFLPLILLDFRSYTSEWNKQLLLSPCKRADTALRIHLLFGETCGFVRNGFFRIKEERQSGIFSSRLSSCDHLVIVLHWNEYFR